MKKSTLIKTGKIILGCFALLFFVTLCWANWKPFTYTELNVPSAEYVAFDLSSAKKGVDQTEIENNIRLVSGVTACSVNGSAKLAGVMFITSIISQSDLEEKITAIIGGPVSEKIVEPAKNGCPVGGITSLVLGLKQTLRFRN